MAKRDTMLDEWVEIVRACLAEGKSYQEIAEREKKEMERGGKEVEPSLAGKRISCYSGDPSRKEISNCGTMRNSEIKSFFALQIASERCIQAGTVP